jgi:hypothetical protein
MANDKAAELDLYELVSPNAAAVWSELEVVRETEEVAFETVAEAVDRVDAEVTVVCEKKPGVLVAVEDTVMAGTENPNPVVLV